MKYFSTYPIIIDNTTVKIDVKVSSDASGSGYFVVNLDRHIKLKSAPFSEVDSLRFDLERIIYPKPDLY